MKKLTVVAFVVFGLMALDHAQAQQGNSTDDDHVALERTAKEVGNTELENLLHGFQPITLNGDSPDSGGSVWVPGDVKTRIDWNGRAPQKVRIWNGAHVTLAPEQLLELTSRKQALISAGVVEAPAPTQEAIDADARTEAVYTPQSAPPQTTTPTAPAPPAAGSTTITPATPETKTHESPVNWGFIFELITAAWTFAVISAVWRRRKSADPKKVETRRGYEEAVTGIPHGKFEKTAQGFKFTFKNKKSLDPGCLSFTGPMVWGSAVGYTGMIFAGVFAGGEDALPAAFISAVGWTLIYAFIRPNHNRIEVTRDVVIINGKRFKRSDFRGFTTGQMLYSRQPGPRDQEHLVGYHYGAESYTIPGVWREQQVIEMGVALNDHLRDVPEAGAGDRPNPEQLRNTRPTDF